MTASSSRRRRTGLHQLCEGYQLFFRHLDQPMQVVANLLKVGRDAAGVRQWYAAADTKRSPATP
jgi:uncharacterized protein